MLDIIGHKQVTDFFAKVIENDNLSHAYCFTGPKSVGKLKVAQHLAAQILNIAEDKLFSSPDFILVEQIIKEKTGKLSKDIGVEQIRKSISFLNRSSFSKDGYKVAIIDRADLLNISASNAFLKTLEEPRSKTILFLIVEDDNKLLATIRSRCQTIHFSLVANDDMKSYLETLSLSEEKKNIILKQSCGLAGLAVQLATDEEFYKNYFEEVTRFNNIFGKYFYEKLQLVEDLFGDKTDHIQARNNLIRVLNIWQMQLHLLLKENSINKKLFLNIYNSIKQANKLLLQNVHPRLLVENILLQII
ncbi:MAG: DNA polymerase III, delta prime subunit [uncultured bacterium]|nr:MAG: DNA polymerase III, delta prime subunit [uncultured bacterium]HAO52617.1 hypothetical protein [Candidatus Magasanikbacteria bacterium]